MRIRYLHQPTDCDPRHQGDAPQPDHGGLQLPPRGQVRGHPEGQGAEEDPADADQHLEPRHCQPHLLTALCPILPRRGHQLQLRRRRIGNARQSADDGRRDECSQSPLAERAARGVPAVPPAAPAVHGHGSAASTISTSVTTTA